MLNFNAIQGVNSGEIVAHIKQFPFEDYEICSVPGYGCFYLDINKPDIIKYYLREKEPWEKHYQQYIQKFVSEGSVVIDVGAHIGTLTLTMAKAVGPRGKVMAFEPQLKLFRELFMNMALNESLNIDYFYSAVGNCIGKAELSPSDPINEGHTKLEGGTGQFVDVITIDSLKFERVDLIKIDVEGMEKEVLQGAYETILKHRPVLLVEINEKSAIEELIRLGYFVFWLTRRDYIAFPWMLKNFS